MSTSCYPTGCEIPPPIVITNTHTAAAPPAPHVPAGSLLPVTGGDIAGVAAWGLGLALVGAVLVRRSRHRRHEAEQGAGGLYR